MSEVMLAVLAEEALKGNKPSSTFKPESLARVVQAMKDTFNLDCTADHVLSHLKTVKNNWKIICTLKEKSGFGWNEELKMITVDQAVFNEEVMVILF